MSLRLWAGVAFAGLLISACDQLVGKEGKLIAEAEKAVAAKLIDPTTPLFSDVTTNGADTVCGWVNGKNRLGAYAGKQRFYVAYGSATLENETIQDRVAFPGVRSDMLNSGQCKFDREFRICKGETGVPDPLDCLLTPPL